MTRAAKGGERQHGNAGREVEAARGLRGAERDLNQIFGGGIDVHAGIGEQIQLARACDHQVAARDPFEALARANDLQGRPDGVGEMLAHAGDQSIGLAHVYHHGAEDVWIFHERARFAESDAAALTDAEQLLDKWFAQRRGRGIDDLSVFEVQTEFVSPILNGGRVAEQDRVGNQHVPSIARELLQLPKGPLMMLVAFIVSRI
jgi:hypothetical protein